MYALVGVALLGGAGGLYLWSQGNAAPDAKPKAEPEEKNRRRSASVEETIEVPDELPTEAQPGVAHPTKKRAVQNTSDEWDCQGELDVAAVRQFVSQHQTDVRSCYEKRLKNNPQLAGQLQLTVKVGKDGRVQGARTGGSLGDTEVYNCVKKMAGSWQLSVPSGGICAVVKVPFSLTPKS